MLLLPLEEVSGVVKSLDIQEIVNLIMGMFVEFVIQLVRSLLSLACSLVFALSYTSVRQKKCTQCNN